MGHAEQRAKLQKFADTLADWKTTEPVEFENGAYRRGVSIEPQPAFPSPSIVDGLPGEFADYFEGAIAWDNPGLKDKSVARQPGSTC